MYPNKTLLLSITGSSPAVVTETLYGIDRAGQEWPSAIKIITTTHGKSRALDAFIEKQKITDLCNELKKPHIPFSEDDILVVTNNQGMEVADARNLEDHEALANFIMSKVHQYSNDEHTKIHASIAGGRKTMTFYLGYAMSLFGRHFDRLSHVLVSEGFENPHLGFYYPTLEDKKKEVDGKIYNFKEAEVTLADIPFIRQRNLMPEMMKTIQADQESTIDFRKLVELVNLGENPAAIQLKVIAKKKLLKIYNQQSPNAPLAEIQFPNSIVWCLYLLLLAESHKEKENQGDYIRPKRNEQDYYASRMVLETFIELFVNNKHLSEARKADLARTSDVKEYTEVACSILEDYVQEFMSEPKLISTIKSLKEGYNSSRWSNQLNDIKTVLADKLPKNLVKVLEPNQIYMETTAPYGKKGKGGDGYGVDLMPKQILISYD